MTFVESVRDAMDVTLQNDPTASKYLMSRKYLATQYFLELVLLGEDIAFGGVFRATEGLQNKHGLSCNFSFHVSYMYVQA